MLTMHNVAVGCLLVLGGYNTVVVRVFLYRPHVKNTAAATPLLFCIHYVLNSHLERSPSLMLSDTVAVNVFSPQAIAASASQTFFHASQETSSVWRPNQQLASSSQLGAFK